jgi:hypothetical protein
VEDVLIAPPPTPHELRQDIEELRDNLEASVANGTFEEKLEAARVIEGGGPEGRKSLETGGESSDPARDQGTSSARPIDATSSKRVKHTDESILGKIKLDEEFPFVYGKGFTEEGYRKATARPVEFPSDAWQHFTGGQGRGPQSRIKAMQLVRKRLGLRHSEDKEEMLYMIAEELEAWEKLREQRLGIPAPVVDSVTMRQGKGSMTMAMTDPAVKLPQKRQEKEGQTYHDVWPLYPGQIKAYGCTKIRTGVLLQNIKGLTVEVGLRKGHHGRRLSITNHDEIVDDSEELVITFRNESAIPVTYGVEDPIIVLKITDNEETHRENKKGY